MQIASNAGGGIITFYPQIIKQEKQFCKIKGILIEIEKTFYLFVGCYGFLKNSEYVYIFKQNCIVRNLFVLKYDFKHKLNYRYN